MTAIHWRPSTTVLAGWLPPLPVPLNTDGRLLRLRGSVDELVILVLTR